MANTMIDCGDPRGMVPDAGNLPRLAPSSPALIESSLAHPIRHPWFRARRCLASIACAVVLVPAAILIELVETLPAAAYTQNDKGPGWVDKYAKYFDQYNEFNRTHLCLNYDDYDALAEIWRTADAEFRDDIAELEKLEGADDAKIAELDEKIKRVQANFKAALQVSTHTVHDPADYIAELTRDRQAYVDDKRDLARRINALGSIQLQLEKLYHEITDKPICTDGPGEPPTNYWRRCAIQPHVTACKPCKTEVQVVNELIDVLNWSFGTYESCKLHEDVVRDAKKTLQACIKAKCSGHSGYFPGHQLREGEAYVSFDGNKWCTFVDGAATTAMLIPLDDDDSQIEVSMAPPIGPGGPGPVPQASDKLPTPARAASVNEKPGPTPEKPITDKPTTNPPPAPPTSTTDVTPPALDDTPSEIPDNVELKVTQEVLQDGQTGQPIEGQTIKLTQSEKADLPVPVDPRKPVPTETAVDRGFDKPTSQCVTDARGACTIPVSPDDRPHYHLPELAKGKHQNYRLDIARPQTSGAVAEIKPGKEKIDPKALQSIGHDILSSTFKIGDRMFTRLSLETKYDADARLAPKFTDAYGPSYEEDLCREKYPRGSFDSANERSAEMSGTTVVIKRSRQ
jgi:hypothetical protein